ncbi:hypothetical protein ZHAS_00005864 [Anopheles sinensis]|uniref:Uncharacterized protein n=1 Tax=Anopheles sinensis TaxID=74873 RepID=A0A084VKE4_ANOSI|nr:hypothetical protein ZHAS_00005864 [Anopheles sinensis]
MCHVLFALAQAHLGHDGASLSNAISFARVKPAECEKSSSNSSGSITSMAANVRSHRVENRLTDRNQRMR